jgi:quinol-cytochrome oxidoreductase complex cytochrome b subunit
MFQTLKMIPAKIGPVEGEVFAVVVFGLAGLLLLLIPFLDRSARREQPNRWLSMAGWIAVIYIAVMTLLGYRT